MNTRGTSQRPMRVAMLLPELRVTGGVRRSLLLCQEFARQGHEVLIACPGGPLVPWLSGSWAEHGPRPAGTTGRVSSADPPKAVPVFPHRMILWPVRGDGRPAFGATRAIAGPIREFRPDVIHVGSLTRAVPFASVLTKVEAVRVATIHSALDVSRIPRRRMAAFDVLLAVTSAVQLALIERGQPRSRIVTVKPGAPARLTLQDNGLLSPLPAVPAVPTIGCVDPLDRLGELATLIEACRLCIEGGQDLRLVITGSGPATRAVANEIRRLDAKDWAVVISGCTDPSTPLECQAMVSCTGSLDGSQYALEAMGAGVPALLVNQESNPEIVRDGMDGLIWSPGDAEGLSQMILRAICSGPERRRLIAAAVETVSDKLSVSRMADGTLAAYQRGHISSESGRFSAVTRSGRSATVFDTRSGRGEQANGRQTR